MSSRLSTFMQNWTIFSGKVFWIMTAVCSVLLDCTNLCVCVCFFCKNSYELKPLISNLTLTISSVTFLSILATAYWLRRCRNPCKKLQIEESRNSWLGRDKSKGHAERIQTSNVSTPSSKHTGSEKMMKHKRSRSKRITSAQQDHIYRI